MLRSGRILLMTRIMPLVLVLLFVGAEAEAQRNCRKGIPCGNSCISASKTCRIGAPRAPAREAAEREPDVERQADAEVTSVPVVRSLLSSADAPAPALRPVRYVGSAAGNVYYPVSCAVAREIPDALRVYFQSDEAARLLKYVRANSPGC